MATKLWFSIDVNKNITKLGLYMPRTISKRTIFYREESENEILVHSGPPGFQKIFTKEQFDLCKIDGTSRPVRNEVSEGLETSFWENKEALAKQKAKEEEQNQQKQAYDILSDEDKVKYDRLKNANKILSDNKSKSKKDKIIALHKAGYSKQEIFQVLPTDNSYMEEVYTKYITGFN